MRGVFNVVSKAVYEGGHTVPVTVCHTGSSAALAAIFRLKAQGYGMLPVLSSVGLHRGAALHG